MYMTTNEIETFENVIMNLFFRNIQCGNCTFDQAKNRTFKRLEKECPEVLKFYLECKPLKD